MASKVLDDFLKKMRGSDRKQEDESFRESYALLQVIFDQAFHLMGLLKPDGTVLKINPKAYSLIKGRESGVIGKPFWETPWWAHSPEQQAQLREAIKVAAQGEFVRFEATHKTTKGKLIYVDFSLKPVMDENGNVVLLLPEGRDITERKKAEDVLRESEWKFRAIFDQNFQLMGLLAIDGTVIKINRTALRLTGIEESDVIGEPFWETPWWSHSPDQQERLREAITEAARGEYVSFEATHPAADGTLHHIAFSLKPVKDQTGKVVLLVPEGRDITERKRAEEALLEAAVKYRIVADNTYNWEFWLNPEGQFIYTSPSCQRISGHAAAEFNADPALLWSIIHPDDRHLWASHRHDITQGKDLGDLEFRIVRPEGDIRWIHHVCQPVFDDNGNYLGTRGSFSDITEQKKAARALLDNARIKRELEIAKEIQQSFLAACPRELPGMLTACRCEPAAHVGGDYYDFFSLEGGVVDVAIADVTGHSIGSSLLMSMMRSVLHAKVSASRSPGELLATINDLLHDDLSRAELQISMFYARLDTENRTLAYANAGHNPPLLFRSREGMTQELDADGLLMGVRTDVFFEEKITRMETGDILVLYTDGVTEAENAEGELFGVRRLRGIVAEHCGRHPEEIMAAVFRKLSAFAGSRPLLDDVAMTIFKTV